MDIGLAGAANANPPLRLFIHPTNTSTLTNVQIFAIPRALAPLQNQGQGRI